MIDYAKALPDLENRLIRSIGDPDERYIEDPVRMLRAVRFAATLDFTIEEQAYAAILRQVSHLAEASNARLYEEVLKFTRSGAMRQALPLLRETGLLRALFPLCSAWFDTRATAADIAHAEAACAQLDEWKERGVDPSPALAYTMLFSAYHSAKVEERVQSGRKHHEAVTEVFIDHQRSLVPTVLVPQRQLTNMIRVAAVQPAFLKHDEKKAKRLKSHPCFHDAFLYFQFQCKLRDANHDRVKYWRELEAPAPPKPKRRKRRRRKPHHPQHEH